MTRMTKDGKLTTAFSPISSPHITPPHFLALSQSRACPIPSLQRVFACLIPTSILRVCLCICAASYVLNLCVLVLHRVYHVCSIGVFTHCTVCSICAPCVPGKQEKIMWIGGRARFSSSCPAEIISTITAATTQHYTVSKEQQRVSEKEKYWAQVQGELSNQMCWPVQSPKS